MTQHAYGFILPPKGCMRGSIECPINSADPSPALFIFTVPHCLIYSQFPII